MVIELTEEQCAELQRLLEEFLGDLSSEIADTDNPGYREGLRRQRVQGEGEGEDAARGVQPPEAFHEEAHREVSRGQAERVAHHHSGQPRGRRLDTHLAPDAFFLRPGSSFFTRAASGAFGARRRNVWYSLRARATSAS